MNYKNIAKWAVGRDVGASSQFLAACALGNPALAEIHYPLDKDDFGRCFRLARVLDKKELERALELSSECHNKWKIIRKHWEHLQSVYWKQDGSDFNKLLNALGL